MTFTEYTLNVRHLAKPGHPEDIMLEPPDVPDELNDMLLEIRSGTEWGPAAYMYFTNEDIPDKIKELSVKYPEFRFDVKERNEFDQSFVHYVYDGKAQKESVTTNVRPFDPDRLE